MLPSFSIKRQELSLLLFEREPSCVKEKWRTSIRKQKCMSAKSKNVLNKNRFNYNLLVEYV